MNILFYYENINGKYVIVLPFNKGKLNKFLTNYKENCLKRSYSMSCFKVVIVHSISLFKQFLLLIMIKKKGVHELTHSHFLAKGQNNFQIVCFLSFVWFQCILNRFKGN